MPEYIGKYAQWSLPKTTDAMDSASQSTKVNKRLMLNVTMPRLFTPGDVIEIPVTLFAMKENIKNVTVNIKTDE